MPDNKKRRAPEDGKRINVHQAWEVRYWTKAFGISKDELVALVKEHGVSVKKVRAALAAKENNQPGVNL